MPLWAKVDVDMPVDEKLFGQPIATRWLWLCLISLAKKQDHAGAVQGYDCALLASRYNVPRKCVAKALTHYQAVRMVELDPDGTIRLLNFNKRQGPEDTSAERSGRYYESHRETVLEKRKVSRSKSHPSSHGVLTAVSRETVSLEGEKEEERDGEKAKASPQGAVAPAATAAVWDAYSSAYRARYSEPPPDSKKARGLLKRFLEQVSRDEAPQIAAAYLTHNGSLYVNAMHPLELLLRDAPKLRTEWATGKRMTSAAARQQDQTQANLDGWAEHMSEEGRNALVGK
jgi:hypothetical protein